jgi:serine/threonine protein kinase
VVLGTPAEEFGPYVVYEELGVGGMASVHRAESRGLAGFRRPVALKRMLPHVAAMDDFVKAFVREARIASHLHHVNCAQTYELGKVNGIYFIAMELVTGKNLRQLLKHCAQMTGPMPVALTLNILNQICDALDYAHNLRDESGQPLGIIHRDVSPSNIIVSEQGVVKLIDFGIAKASAAGMQTMSGMLKGKFGYMAPEYIAGSIDARADLFAVGVIAHELLTNRPLFTGRDDMETLNKVRGMVIKPPSARNPKCPTEIDEIVMTALERDPDRRWQHATALRSALTTMTKRLQLDVSNPDVAEWIDWAFGQERPIQVEINDGITNDTTGVNARDEPTRVDAPVKDDLRKTTRLENVRPTPIPHRSATAEVAAPRHSTVAPVRGSDPNLIARPQTPVRASDPNLIRPLSPSSPPPGVGMGSQPPSVIVSVQASPNPAVAKIPHTKMLTPAGPQRTPTPLPLPHSGEVTRVVDDRTGNGRGATQPVKPLPAPKRKSRAGLVIVTLLGLAAAAAAVLYFVLLRT